MAQMNGTPRTGQVYGVFITAGALLLLLGSLLARGLLRLGRLSISNGLAEDFGKIIGGLGLAFLAIICAHESLHYAVYRCCGKGPHWSNNKWAPTVSAACCMHADLLRRQLKVVPWFAFALSAGLGWLASSWALKAGLTGRAVVVAIVLVGMGRSIEKDVRNPKPRELAGQYVRDLGDDYITCTRGAPHDKTHCQ